MRVPGHLVVNHANKAGMKVYLDVNQIFGVWFSEATASTFIMASGGAIVPVAETPEQVIKLKQAELTALQTNKDGNK